MTTIRRIPTSKIDGNNSNSTDANEIRPYGEIAVYVGDNNKLELLMFDGVRTHLKSKVLNKGTFYGGDSDSGDGEGLDTIKLVPDEVLRRNGSDQYLVIDPTGGEPNHIHIRAGGTIDSSSTDLFLGGEKNNVRVSDINDRVTISTDAGEGTRTWTFDNEGNLTAPKDIIVGGEGGGHFVIDATEGYNTSVRWYNMPVDSAQSLIRAYTGNPDDETELNRGRIQLAWQDENRSGLRIISYDRSDEDNVATPEWTFQGDGDLVLPEGGAITEGVVTDNPTIELTPANPDVTSQKLVIKGGAGDDYHLHLTNGDLTETSLIIGTDEHNIRTITDGAIQITAYDYSVQEQKYWYFSPQGSLTFPDITTQTTAWSGGRVVDAPASSTGAEGDKAGDLAFSTGHIYYCFEDYDTGVSYNTTLSNITEDDNKFIFAKGEGIIEPEIGWSITVDVGGENEETHTITLVEDLATDWRVTWSGGNVTFNPGTAIRIFSTNIWKRVAWSNDVW
jgi:hypothetical protein